MRKMLSTVQENWLGLLLVTLGLAGMASFAEGATIGELTVPAPLVGSLFIIMTLVFFVILLSVTERT